MNFSLVQTSPQHLMQSVLETQIALSSRSKIALKELLREHLTNLQSANLLLSMVKSHSQLHSHFLFRRAKKNLQLKKLPHTHTPKRNVEVLSQRITRMRKSSSLLPPRQRHKLSLRMNSMPQSLRPLLQRLIRLQQLL